MPARLAILALLMSAGSVAAQPQGEVAPPGLFHEIATADSVMFSAFNAGDLATLRTMFTEDLEFYHDQTGLTSYEENMAAFEGLFARGDGLRRDLVRDRLEVYPVGDHGAIQVGAHTFCHVEGDREDCGTFPFVTVWRKEDAAWKVARVISYDH
jgi:ketosteroid isomerase-like protein